MILWALRKFVGYHARQVQASMERPREAQTAALGRLKAIVSGLERCATLDELRRLPPADSGRLAPAGSGVLGFLRTSGSSAEPKLVPINRAYLASLDRTLIRMVCSQLFTGGDWSSVFSGRHVFLSSRPRVGTSPGGLPIYDASALYPTRAPWWVRWSLLPRHADLWLDDWALKRDRTLEQARRKNVISLNGLPALAIDFAARAKERFGVKHLDELWPRLRQLSYGGVALPASQRAHLREAWFSPGHEFQFVETYFASEAPLGFAFDAGDDALALNTLENLYLFRPEQGGELLLADELAAGQRYLLHVTTPGGLVNVKIGDLIEVVSTRPLLVRIAGREGEELSLTGEKLTVAQLDFALAAAGLGPERLGVHLPVAFRGGTEDRPRLVWGVPGADVDPARLDEGLCRANVLYAEALQIEKVIDGSVVERIPVAVFEAHRQARLGNYKPKRLFESREAFAAYYGFNAPAGPAPAGG